MNPTEVLLSSVQRLGKLRDTLKDAARPGSESQTLLLLAASLVELEMTALTLQAGILIQEDVPNQVRHSETSQA